MAQTLEPPRQPRTRESLPEQADLARGPAREVRQGRRNAMRRRCARRVARALARPSPKRKRAHWEARFLEAQERGFIPAGRINSAAGTSLTATLINCFVQPVGDSITEVVDGKPGIYTALPRPPRPCAAAAAWATTSPRSAPRARWVQRHAARARAARCRTCACSTSRARRSNRPARAAARRWACCAATIRTSRDSSTPRTRATSPTSTSPSA